MKRLVSVLAVVFVLFCFSSLAVAGQGVPLGLKWGMSIEEVKAKGYTLRRETRPEKTADHKVYWDPNKRNVIKGVNNSGIFFDFYKDRLCGITICILEGNEDSMDLLKKSLIEKYGEPPQTEPMYNVYGTVIGEELTWPFIRLKYNWRKGNGMVSYHNKDMDTIFESLIDKQDQQAKETANDL
jgi:hypothetical protein